MFKYVALVTLLVAAVSSTSIGNAQYSIKLQFNGLNEWKTMNAVFKNREGYKVNTVAVYDDVKVELYVSEKMKDEVMSYVNSHNIHNTIKALPNIPRVVLN